jgi:xylulokinase
MINVDEGPAYGVALLAGVGAGVWPSVQEACRSTIRVVNETRPDAAQKAAYDDFYDVYRALYPALKAAYELDAKAVAKHYTGGASG